MRNRIAVLLLMPLVVVAVRAQPATLAVGTALPAADHTVQHVGGGQAAVSSLTGTAGTVFIFWSNTCRWTEGYRARVEALHAAAAAQNVAMVLVNSNDARSFPEEGLQSSAAHRHTVPYVHDPGAVLARALGAYRTPEVFAFDGAGALAYAGAIDDAPGDEAAVQQSFVGDFLSGKPSAPTKAFGCRIRFPEG